MVGLTGWMAEELIGCWAGLLVGLTGWIAGELIG